MDKSEELKRLENIEFLLASAIENMNKIVADANDPQKRQKEAEILTRASERLNLLSSEISGLVSKEQALIEGFKPTVEVKHYNVDFKKPGAWIVAAIFVMVVSSYISYHFYERKEFYKARSDEKYDNFMKYRYLKIYGSEQTQAEITKLDKIYDDQWQKIDSMTRTKERKLREAASAAALAKVKEEEAKRLKQQADSLRGK
jgi:hypothetical protein